MSAPAIKRAWVDVCRVDDLIADVGVRALVGGVQVAVFKVSGFEAIYAVGAIDPFSGAAVLSRGIVGDLKGELVVASPIYKQHFRLTDGVCIEDPSVTIPVFATRINSGLIQVAR